MPTRRSTPALEPMPLAKRRIVVISTKFRKEEKIGERITEDKLSNITPRWHTLPLRIQCHLWVSLELLATGKFGIIQTKKSFSSLVGDARIPRVPTTQILWSATGMNSDLTSIEFQNQNQFLHRYNNCKALCKAINSIRFFLS